MATKLELTRLKISTVEQTERQMDNTISVTVSEQTEFRDDLCGLVRADREFKDGVCGRVREEK